MLIFVGVLFSLGLGSIMPVYAILMNSLIFGLSQFMHSLERVRANADYYCLLMFVLALCCYSFACIQKFTFGYVSEGVTLKVRRQLYSKVLSLHMGWFDRKENAPG